MSMVFNFSKLAPGIGRHTWHTPVVFDWQKRRPHLTRRCGKVRKLLSKTAIAENIFNFFAGELYSLSSVLWGGGKKKRTIARLRFYVTCVIRRLQTTPEGAIWAIDVATCGYSCHRDSASLFTSVRKNFFRLNSFIHPEETVVPSFPGRESQTATGLSVKCFIVVVVLFPHTAVEI